MHRTRPVAPATVWRHVGQWSYESGREFTVNEKNKQKKPIGNIRVEKSMLSARWNAKLETGLIDHKNYWTQNRKWKSGGPK